MEHCGKQERLLDLLAEVILEPRVEVVLSIVNGLPDPALELRLMHKIGHVSTLTTPPQGRAKSGINTVLRSAMAIRTSSFMEKSLLLVK